MTIVYQKLFKSDYESKSHSHMLEPLTLTLKLTNSCKQKTWGAIEQLSSSKMEEKEQVYVHPLAHKWLSNLRAESLEMCTESLGSETGAFITESTDFVSSPLSSSSNKNYHQSYHNNSSGSNSNKTDRFPPPLTTMSGSSSLHVKSYREDGRLVMKAVLIPTIASCFRTERTNGRLKLLLVKRSRLDNKRVENEERYEQEEDERVENKGGNEGITMEYGIKMENVVVNNKLQQWKSSCKDGRESNKRYINQFGTFMGGYLTQIRRVGFLFVVYNFDFID